MKTKYQGIIFIIISAFFFSLMFLFVALADENIPTAQKAFFRNIVAAAISFVMLMRKPSDFKTIKGNWVSVLIRSVAGTAGIFLNFYAIDNMNISDASMLNKLSPFFGIVFSLFILREKPSWVEWVAVIAAFGGAVFIALPGFGAGKAWEFLPALAGVGGGMMAGLAYTFMRKASLNGAARNMIVFMFSFISSLIFLPPMIITFRPMSWLDTLYLFLAGTAAAGGQIFITMAYAKAPAKSISVFDYTIIIFSAIWGAIFLGQYPVWQSYVGYVIIIAAAISVWLYHLYRDKYPKVKKTKEPIDLNNEKPPEMSSDAGEKTEKRE